MRVIPVPRSIFWQLIFLVAITAVIFHFCMAFTFFIARSAGKAAPAGNIVEPIIDLANAADLVPADHFAKLAARFAATHPQMHAKMVAISERQPPKTNSALSHKLQSRLPAGSTIFADQHNRLILQTREGSSISMIDDEQAFGPPHLADLAFATTLFVALSATLFLVWAIRNIIVPLATFAEAADRFALDEQDQPLSESGSTELRTASRAFNRMQARMQSMIQNRTFMFAAIGHDLRTPITRLRLRAEYISELSLQQAIVRDLDVMDKLVHSALSFLKGNELRRNKQPIDLATLLQSICDDFTDTGSRVCFDGPDHATIRAHAEDLRRMFSNLIGNAVAHGKVVSVILKWQDAEIVEIDVCDDGPGMTDTDKLNAFEPFWRGDASRGNLPGFGLGLSIAQSIAGSHEGVVTLLDATSGGLICRVQLPA